MHRNRRKYPKTSAASPRKRGDARQDEAPAREAQDKKKIRAGEALLRAAMDNPQAYPAVFRMLRLKQYAQENPGFAEALRAVWEPVRQGNEAIAAALLQRKRLSATKVRRLYREAFRPQARPKERLSLPTTARRSPWGSISA